ncbi:sensor histidine kinase [Pseudobacteriovorax antillogorgiicola]|uniref:histidine kinase n=1 Tax=Pseudobacteriovorax antillogorgiicola TaxID=1513793 RepID=A0A1Y6BNL2_9BACT|nr:HAMP domain-containing sensor histidine kinase [Pseudobacteriovorax antillogorgiicola]TCS55396.1 signal transduction histidine kinase [Pseudobacteriovorax antillogorgiicola]SMF13066.1 Signal transduction histidine kinase [Pseudobacteriovorax antillogorgiicola]
MQISSTLKICDETRRWEQTQIPSYSRSVAVFYACTLSLILTTQLVGLYAQPGFIWQPYLICLLMCGITILSSYLTRLPYASRVQESMLVLLVVCCVGFSLFKTQAHSQPLPHSLETVMFIFMASFSSYKFKRAFASQLLMNLCLIAAAFSQTQSISKGSLTPAAAIVVSGAFGLYLRRLFNGILHTKLRLQRQQSIVESQARELEKTIQEKSILLKILCHDVTNPIAVIDSYAELLAKRNSFKEAKVNEWIAKIQSACHSTREILDHIQDLEALYSEKKSLPLKPVRLDQAIEQALHLLEDAISQKKIQVNIKTIGEKQTAFVAAEPRSLAYQVLLNLLGNAIKFSFEGGTIDIETQTLNTYVLVRIRDYGVGIPTAVRDRILDPRSQYSSLGTLGEQGNGFGLTIVNAYIKKYGGSLAIESAHNEDGVTGTTFEIRLSRAENRDLGSLAS